MVVLVVLHLKQVSWCAHTLLGTWLHPVSTYMSQTHKCHVSNLRHSWHLKHSCVVAQGLGFAEIERPG